MATKRKLLYGALGVLIIIGAFAISGHMIKTNAKPERNKEKQNVVYVQTNEVTYNEIVSEMNCRGRVTAFDQISLASEVQGKIMKGDVRFKPGESFSKNDLLVHIYNEDVKASLRSGKSSLLQILSIVLPDVKVDFPDEYEKWNSFFTEITIYNSLPQLPSMHSDKEKVYMAANNVLSTYYSLQQQEIALRRYSITAPFNGSFKKVNREIGAIASPGVELATIIRSDKLEVTVPVFSDDLKWIKKGDKVNVTNNNGKVITAIVSRTASFVDESTQSVNVYLTFQTDINSTFLSGEYVDVSFGGKSVSGFEIAREAIVDGSYVYELSDKKLTKEKINIIRQLDDSYVIAGVDTGKVIVTESLPNINKTAEYKSR